MDHDLYRWSPFPARKPWQLPAGYSLAIGIVVSVDYLEPAHVQYTPLTTRWPIVRAGGAIEEGPSPFTSAGYGARAGFFGLSSALAREGLPATLAIDTASLVRFPEVVDQARVYGWEILAHGISAHRPITSAMSERDELDYVREVQSAFSTNGLEPAGWLGPEYSESYRTPRVLAELGFRYICDWANDDQPYAAAFDSNFIFVPAQLDYDDRYSLLSPRFLKIDEYCRMIEDGVKVLACEGIDSGRCFIWVLHADVMGQPFRLRYFERLVMTLSKTEGVWFATPSQIVESFVSQL